ncbi:PglL family O-oligosaccharyltransferase [Klebsiella aerogenes]|uniref:PglL family O-oligosaccharyltransferase n=1 Tax=Klebsiella aerogenes TaxID=548 RepID=UPI000DA14F06|nr:O-antigen ligase family protein [Klebsiella aerogenes]HCB2860391.1 O-antigen ligase C-terminal domain-containing protein [Klebsiella aerogenes]HCB2865724.1 O-antigen ligase C-terminal domain-containing protein [Klebsiella aerogenes]HCB2881623.1 O-antigen ligase C-terminal domain-containing protein [Klebsiella aerogenes]HCB3346413.1 O-antigen ligase C-terminal domain-containing protein [Klebsiella aerogenes]HCM1812459.1 O-antigen ligase C-terminal domain-containing protein [Klebsiella aeroge
MKSNSLTSLPDGTTRMSLAGTVLLAGMGGFWLIFVHLCWPNHGGWGTDLPGNLLAWSFVSALSALFWCILPGSQRITTHSSLPWLLAGAVLMSLPLLWSPSSATFYYALPRIAGLWAGLAFLLTLQQCRFSPAQVRFLLYCLTGAGLVEAVIVLLELYGPNAWLPLTWQKLIHQYARGGVGVFQQVNVTASFLAMSLSTALLLLGMRSAAFASRQAEYVRRGALACTIILASAMLTTIYSRTGWLGGMLVVGGIFIIFTSGRFHEKGQFRWLLILLPVTGIIIGLGLMNLSVFQALETHEGSNAQRLLTLRYTFVYALQHPFIGHGAGTYEGYYQSWLASLPGGNPGGEVMSFPHNELLYQYAEGGLIALAGALCWCVMYLRLWWKAKTLLQAGALMAMLPVLLHSQLEYPLYFSVPHWLALLLLLSLADSPSSDKQISGRNTLSILVHPLMLMIMLYASVTSFQAYYSGQTLDKFETNELTDPEEITSLTVPWVHHLRYEQDLTLLRLIRFQSNPDKASLQAFLRENQLWISVHPWAPLYVNQITVLRFLHQDAEVGRWLMQARLTLPWKPQFQVQSGRQALHSK